MDFQTAVLNQNALNDAVNVYSKRLRAFDAMRVPPLNLLPDNVRTSPEYRAAKEGYDKAFAALRAFNQTWVRKYPKEFREYHQSKRLTKIAA